MIYNILISSIWPNSLTPIDHLSDSDPTMNMYSRWLKVWPSFPREICYHGVPICFHKGLDLLKGRSFAKVLDRCCVGVSSALFKSPVKAADCSSCGKNIFSDGAVACRKNGQTANQIGIKWGCIMMYLGWGELLLQDIKKIQEVKAEAMGCLKTH